MATITAGLLAACTTSGSTGPTSKHTTPTRSLSSSAHSSSAPSYSAPPSRGCRPATVHALVVQFVRAFNRGDRKTLDQLWAQDGYGFDWYTTDAPGQRFHSAAKDRAGLVAYFAARHAAGESLRLTSFHFNGNSAEYGNFQYSLIRRADDLAPTAYSGKGAAICASTRSRLGVWSMAKTPTA